MTEQNRQDGQNISNDKKELLDNIYNVFKDTTAMQLVEFTHMSDSPWSEVWEKNGRTIGYGENSYINKIKSKDWFRQTFEKAK